MLNVPGQIDLLEVLSAHGDTKDRKAVRHASGDEHRAKVKLPEEISAWYRDHTDDWWYGEEECIGCGQVEPRKGLYVGHGVQFDETGTQLLPAGPGMAENGVCILMSFVAMHANIAQAVADDDPRYEGWRRRCHLHDTPTNKKKCPKSHFTADAEHRARLATKVWGSTAWKELAWS